MNKFRQYIPGFVSGVEPKVHDFESTEQLLAFPEVQEWAKDWPDEGWKFNRFSLSGNRLMAELDSGFRWHVVGFLDSVEGIQIPQWIRIPIVGNLGSLRIVEQPENLGII